jgi:hypothetical protein
MSCSLRAGANMRGLKRSRLYNPRIAAKQAHPGLNPASPPADEAAAAIATAASAGHSRPVLECFQAF